MINNHLVETIGLSNCNWPDFYTKPLTHTPPNQELSKSDPAISKGSNLKILIKKELVKKERKKPSISSWRVA